MTSVIELAAAPFDAEGKPTWSDELDAKVTPGLLSRNVVAVAFPLNGELAVGLVGWRIMRQQAGVLNLRIVALPRPESGIALSAWCSLEIGTRSLADAEPLSLHPHREARFSGIFETRVDALLAAQSWAARVFQSPEDFRTDVDAAQDPPGNPFLGMLREEDVESFLREMNGADEPEAGG